MTKDVEKYIDSCNMYQRIKNRTEIPVGKLKLSEVLVKLWIYLTVDFITKLPLIVGKDAISVVYNRLSKTTYFVATTEETSAEGLPRLFRNNVWKLHRLPECVISDRGPQFAVKLTKKLNRMLEIKTKLSTSFHLQTDRKTKCINQELEQYIQFFVDYKQKNWPKWLAMAKFAVNNKMHSATKVSLFIVNYDRKLRMEANIRKKK